MVKEDFLLSENQLASAFSDGYILLKAVKTHEQCGVYLKRLEDYANGNRPLPEEATVQREPRVERGEVSADGSSDIRKITKVAHDSDCFHDLVLTSSLVGVMQQLMSPNLKLFRADVLMKPSKVGSAKGMHQDSAYWPIEPMDLWSCWMPFDPATTENGCMAVIPGSHKRGVLPHVQVTDDFVIPDKYYRQNDIILVPMGPGDGLFFHSLLLHGTAENRSTSPRRAITMSYMASEYRYTGELPKPDYLHIAGGENLNGV